jgi:HK97 family phage prohead protease
MIPELEKTDEVERRTHTVEMRVKDAGYGKKTPTMEGYGANFNVLSEDLGGFREILMPGCFKDSIVSCDVRGLFNHNPDKILGRNTAGTLRLNEDEKGLRFEIDPPETTYAKDLQVSMSRGDITQCSFGFKVGEDGQSWARDSAGMWIRTITKVEKLYDVSPVTYPAYTSTTCAVRSLLQIKQNEELEEKRKVELEAEEKRKFEMEQLEMELQLMEVGA